MATVRAEFDGRVFIPSDPVPIPPGTKVEIVLPSPVPSLTADELAEWQNVQADIAACPPHFPTVDDATGYSRKRP
jgi:hypothetical protein